MYLHNTLPHPRLSNLLANSMLTRRLVQFRASDLPLDFLGCQTYEFLAKYSWVLRSNGRLYSHPLRKLVCCGFCDAPQRAQPYLHVHLVQGHWASSTHGPYALDAPWPSDRRSFLFLCPNALTVLLQETISTYDPAWVHP